MTQIDSSRKSAIFTRFKPTPHCRIRTRTNKSDFLITHSPLCIKLPRCHSELALTVSCNQIAFSIGQILLLFYHPQTSPNLPPTPYQIDTPAALLESGASQIT